MVVVEPPQLGVLHQIGNPLDFGSLVSGTHDPSGVGPEESFDTRGMHIFFGIRMTMVTPVVTCPPQRSLLRRGRTKQGQYETGTADWS